MDRIEKPKAAPSEYANEGEIPETDPAMFDSPTGREDHLGLAEASRLAASEIKKPIGAQPRSAVTGIHDSGSGANETEDGLPGLGEVLRRSAEDTASGQPDEEDIPVFDRGDMLPRI